MSSGEQRTSCTYSLRPKTVKIPTPAPKPPCVPKPKKRIPKKKVIPTPTTKRPPPMSIRRGSRAPSLYGPKPVVTTPRIVHPTPPRPTFDDSVTCAICLDAVSSNAATRQLFCGHKFHKTCVENWFKTRYSCPVCRSPPDARTDTYIQRFHRFAENLRQWLGEAPRLQGNFIGFPEQNISH
ncbi:hypothetical protein JTE90_002116 [Oedothorax gibbosus]|uniref:RING-type E3 ubiquitin transferase n=1 Tax=Oedothorax gibbosus TaxID=931172 RepID=A0AAV6V7P1_9ARAC|nr:hypothetical protein JTE90_002116 [Oedothorax gibbosus]